MRKGKLNRTEKLLFLIPISLLTLPILLRSKQVNEWWERVNPYGDNLDKIALNLAGQGATNCGHVQNAKVSASRIQADACSVASFKAKKSFRVRYDTKLPNGAHDETYWIIGTAQNQIWYMHFSGSVVTGPVLCSKPTIITVNGRQRLKCP